MLCKYFRAYGPLKQSISKEMNNDDLTLQSITKYITGFATDILSAMIFTFFADL